MQGSLMPDPERAAIVRSIFKHYATGTYTKREILQKATQWGLTNRRGQPLSSQAACGFGRRARLRFNPTCKRPNRPKRNFSRNSKLEEMDVEGSLAFAEHVLPRTADLFTRSTTAPATTVLSRRNRIQRKGLCWNPRDRTGLQLLAANRGWE